MHPTAKEEGGGEGKIRYLWERDTFFLAGPVFMEDAFECYFSRWEKGGEKGEKRRREKKEGGEGEGHTRRSANEQRFDLGDFEIYSRAPASS